MPIPDNKVALHRILGFATFLARYCPGFSEITASLRELIAPENEYRWDIRHTEAFDRLKAMLTSAPVLQYFSPKKEVTIQCDASQAGLGAVLMQDGKVVEYASRTMTKTEQEYAQIEKEMLAVTYAMERFDTYVYARSVTVETDHRPLISIHRKPLAAAPKRLQRMLLRLQRYNYKLVFRPGRDLILADCLSRACPPTATETTFTEELATLVGVDMEQMNDLKLVASAETITKINNSAKSDDEYQQLVKQIISGWPPSPKNIAVDLRPFHTFADELTVSNGLAFKGNRLVVPRDLRAYILERLHSAHTGVNGCIRRARDTVFWPGITVHIKRVVESCNICAHYQQSKQKEPLLSHPVPSRPWEKVGVDIFTFADRDYLCTVDYLSGFFEVDRLPSKKVCDITYCLRQHMARHGLCIELVSDNSPFNSAEFKRFTDLYDIRHVTSSPRYSQSNGCVEHAVGIMKRIMTKARDANSDPLLALLEWRNTPSEQLGPSPAQVMFGRRTRTRLPTANKLLETATSGAAATALTAAKARQAYYYNRTAKARPPFSVGQTVRVKFDERPEWRKAEIAKILPHRSYLVRFEDGTTRRRTSRHISLSAEQPIIADDTEHEVMPPPAQSKQTLPVAPAPAVAVGTTQLGASRVHCGTQPQATAAPLVTRYGRVVKRPARYCE